MWARFYVLLRCRNCSEAFPAWKGALSVIQFATLPFDLKRLITKTRFCCNFCSDKCSDLTRTVSKIYPIGTFHLQQRSWAVLFRSRNCFESSVPSMNRSPIRYAFCDAPFHYPVQCEHSLDPQSFKKYELKYSKNLDIRTFSQRKEIFGHLRIFSPWYS